MTADIKTIAAHGCYGVACITALTIQSTTGVQKIEPVAPITLTESLCELAKDVEIAAVHIGMLGSAEIANVVADFLVGKRLPNVVLDPILKSSSGADLLEPLGIAVLKARLLPLATVITPNVDEAAVLTGLPVTNLDQMQQVAEQLHFMGAKVVVITGGHMQKATDLLSVSEKNGIEQKVFTGELIQSKSTHGTGCAFATALACQLALGRKLDKSVSLAKAYVREAIANAYPVGKGIGPLNHFYKFTKE